jgi:arginyl-tRNA synthetase
MAAGELPRDLDLGRFVVEPPREATHGDLSTNAAMVYAREAKQAGSNSRSLAVGLVADLSQEPDVQSAEAAGPGFINLNLRNDYLAKELDETRQDTRLNLPMEEKPETVVIDYSGPNVAKEMHVGHLRSTIIGDSIARVLDRLGRQATREYYINDAGGQVDVLARSPSCAPAGSRRRHRPDSGGLYPGDYLKPVGESLAREHGAALKDKPSREWLPLVRSAPSTP